jgi:LysR family transcriptional regulator, cyn operon transcriptional activator
MELRQLRTFLAVAETHHFGRAARTLHISQPAVSQQIRKLEEELGTPLFERRGRGARLLQAGETFRAYASRALEDVHAGQRALGALRSLEMGDLRLAYIPSLTTDLVVPAVAAMLGKHPGLRLIAVDGVARRIERLVAEGRADVGLGFAPSREPEVEAEAVLERRLVLVAPRRHPLMRQARVAAKKLDGAPLALLGRGLRVRAQVDAYLASVAVAPAIRFEARSVATVLAMVRAGLALTILPEPREGPGEGLANRPLTPAPAALSAALLWRKGAPRTFAAEAFADEVRRLATA